MAVPILLAAMLSQAPLPAVPIPAEEAVQEIVVTANRKGRCRVQLEDRNLSDKQLAANARSWAATGVPVRVVRPRGAGYDCMARIAFSLGRHGVRLIQFVER